MPRSRTISPLSCSAKSCCSPARARLPAAAAGAPASRCPSRCCAEVVEVASGRRDCGGGVTMTADSGEIWLVRAVSPKSFEFGVIAINLGHESQESSDELRIRVDAVLSDATATLERLGVAHAISEARMRSQTEQLREALIGSVSHELRTPLASILGAATVLSAAPALAGRKEAQGAGARRARRGRTPQQRHPEPARRHAASAATASSRTSNGRIPPISSIRRSNAAATAWPTAASCSICRPICR